MSNEITSKHHVEFLELIAIIEQSQENAYISVNVEMISMYWKIGAYISDKIHNNDWGKSVVGEFSQFMKINRPDLKGFSSSNVWRMRQYYETYRDNEYLSTLSREITWSNNTMIISRAKTDEAREFYLLLTKENRYSHSELKRQMNSLIYERTMISNEKNKLFIDKDTGLTALRDNYTFEFLDVPKVHKENELRKSIVANLREFILELGKDFTFVGEEYRVQVGNKDFYIDLLFFNRTLACLVAIDLKITDFEPQYLGKLEFYLEALDRDVKKKNENPSVGLVLCASKDDMVVEYALSRSMSPALVADYQLHLPDKTLLTERLRELKELANINDDEV